MKKEAERLAQDTAKIRATPFKEVALDYIAAHRAGWKNAKHAQQWENTLRAVKHHSAIPWIELPAFVATLEKAQDLSSKALRFTILTVCRTSEVLDATWAEIDLVAGIWTIPASRMKAGKEHRVPLSQAALDLLIALPHVKGNNHFDGSLRSGKRAATQRAI
ncbi:tyrosine-type recombinase/integrase [Pseudomonas fluorescens]|uniref:tyrosine-type recombinase/integrase n=1 Tax=Pseudomonas fluorescens TaxID=294 RepID=UPI002181F24E|nr:tyrosine-type recombinase/integrase [Pseudomonas fluorescens]